MKYVPIRYLQPSFPQLLCQPKNHDQEDCMELFQCQAPYMYKNIKIQESILMLLDKIIKLYWNQIYTKWMIFFGCSSHSKRTVVLQTQEWIYKEKKKKRDLGCMEAFKTPKFIEKHHLWTEQTCKVELSHLQSHDSRETTPFVKLWWGAQHVPSLLCLGWHQIDQCTWPFPLLPVS